MAESISNTPEMQPQNPILHFTERPGKSIVLPHIQLMQQNNAQISYLKPLGDSELAILKIKTQENSPSKSEKKGQ